MGSGLRDEAHFSSRRFARTVRSQHNESGAVNPPCGWFSASSATIRFSRICTSYLRCARSGSVKVKPESGQKKAVPMPLAVHAVRRAPHWARLNMYVSHFFLGSSAMGPSSGSSTAMALTVHFYLHGSVLLCEQRPLRMSSLRMTASASARTLFPPHEAAIRLRTRKSSPAQAGQGDDPPGALTHNPALPEGSRSSFGSETARASLRGAETARRWLPSCCRGVTLFYLHCYCACILTSLGTWELTRASPRTQAHLRSQS